MFLEKAVLLDSGDVESTFGKDVKTLKKYKFIVRVNWTYLMLNFRGLECRFMS